MLLNIHTFFKMYTFFYSTSGKHIFSRAHCKEIEKFLQVQMLLIHFETKVMFKKVIKVISL